jgi:hypothetical protein
MGLSCPVWHGNQDWTLPPPAETVVFKTDFVHERRVQQIPAVDD